jgi:hypothetical protein
MAGVGVVTMVGGAADIVAVAIAAAGFTAVAAGMAVAATAGGKGLYRKPEP